MIRALSTMGVTLMEVLLVCAASAMIVVLAVRYYQNASSAEAANQVMHLIQAITAAADQIKVGTGNYSQVTDARVSKLVPSMTLPWGDNASITAQSTSFYTVSLPNVSPDICTRLATRLVANRHIVTSAVDCGTTATYSYKYYLTAIQTNSEPIEGIAGQPVSACMNADGSPC